ncbi:hypothetical protein OIBDGNHJ_00053 [Campylobacter phage PC22]|nr:hypothetical protein KJILBIEH_00071 [Campylobacter phage PC10]UZV39923.1 hypothetical protein OIBDGNHJ_00053 [Campylobacter phage PC22]WAK44768.1 hypothetical protein GEEDAMGG_00003 [Campylobacter phage PC11]
MLRILIYTPILISILLIIIISIFLDNLNIKQTLILTSVINIFLILSVQISLNYVSNKVKD